MELSEEILELKDLLTKWGFQHLVSYFISQGIYVKVLKVMKYSHIEKVLKDYDYGTQILFEDFLEKWRESIQLPMKMIPKSEILPTRMASINSYFDYNKLDHKQASNTTINEVVHAPTNQIINIPTTNNDTQLYNSGIPVGDFVISNSPSTSNSAAAEFLGYVRLSTILNVMPKGKLLVTYYNEIKKFNDDNRNMLINTISQYFEEREVVLRLPMCRRLEEEIIETFPTEKLEYYRNDKRGRLYNRYYNSRKKLRTSLGIQPNSSRLINSSNTKNLDPHQFTVPEYNAEEIVKTLFSENLTSTEFDQSWMACVNYRLYSISTLNSIKEITEKWPFYKEPEGYLYINIDFGVLYKDSPFIFDKWSTFYSKAIQFLGGNINDTTIKDVLYEIKTNLEITENSRNAALLWCIHAFLGPTAIPYNNIENPKRPCIKYSVKDSQESFIFVAKSLVEVEQHLESIESYVESVKPFIIAIGEDLFNIAEIYVYLDGTKFQFQSFIMCVDICFKIYRLFRIDYPPASCAFWTFLQHYFYEIIYPNESKYQKVEILKNELKA